MYIIILTEQFKLKLVCGCLKLQTRQTYSVCRSLEDILPVEDSLFFMCVLDIPSIKCKAN